MARSPVRLHLGFVRQLGVTRNLGNFTVGVRTKGILVVDAVVVLAKRVLKFPVRGLSRCRRCHRGCGHRLLKRLKGLIGD